MTRFGLSWRSEVKERGEYKTTREFPSWMIVRMRMSWLEIEKSERRVTRGGR